LKPLIKSTLIKSTLSTVKINEKTKLELINSFYEKYQIDTQQLDNWLIENNLENNDIEDLALENKRLEIFCDEKFRSKIDSYFLERKDQLDIVVYSLLRVKDFFQAKEFFLRITENEADFGDLASKFSEGIEKKTRGIVGPVPIGQSHPKLAELLINSAPGKTQPPIEIDGSYIVVRVELYDPAKLNDYMRKNLQKELFNKSIDSQTNEINLKLLNEGISSLCLEGNN
tara:strand:- start:798 stop:1481 length:684 start_codon:yes stop_codon:yes gene_type:complete